MTHAKFARWRQGEKKEERKEDGRKLVYYGDSTKVGIYGKGKLQHPHESVVSHGGSWQTATETQVDADRPKASYY